MRCDDVSKVFLCYDSPGIVDSLGIRLARDEKCSGRYRYREFALGLFVTAIYVDKQYIVTFGHDFLAHNVFIFPIIRGQNGIVELNNDIAEVVAQFHGLRLVKADSGIYAVTSR